MRPLRSWRLRLWGVFRVNRDERFDEEIGAHLEMHVRGLQSGRQDDSEGRQHRRDFAPTINHRACTRKQATQLTANVRREGGRKAHETNVIPLIPTRYTTVVASWTPETRFDASAPVRWKITPA
jgi:hypothetical protein